MKRCISGLGLSIFAIGCESTPEPTRVTFSLQVAASQSRGLMNDFGAVVDIDEAEVHLQSVEFFEGEPLFARAPGLWDGWLVSTAYAHPGHYVPGEALGDLIEEHSVDLITGADLGVGTGVSGMYKSAKVTLGTTKSEPVARLEGTATSSSGTHRFTSTLSGVHEISGITAGFEVAPGESPRLLMRVDLRSWIARIDFAATSTSSAPTPLAPEGQGQNAFGRGVLSIGSFGFERDG